MKKIAAAFVGIALCLVLVLSFAACGGNGGGGNGVENNNSSSERPENTAGESDNEILVVYFSATGNTERVAGYIAEATGGTVFELVPTDPYTSEDLNYGDPESRVVQEYEDPELRDIALVSTTVDNWAEYDVVFIGYPIWWGIAAWSVNNFVEDNDFTGKTVIPFATSASSGIGQSGTLLAELAGSGTWLDGGRFRSSASEATVVSWIESLDIL